MAASSESFDESLSLPPGRVGVPPWPTTPRPSETREERSGARPPAYAFGAGLAVWGVALAALALRAFG